MIQVEKEGKWREKEKERGMGPSSKSIGTNQVLNGQTGRKKLLEQKITVQKIKYPGIHTKNKQIITQKVKLSLQKNSNQ